MSEGNHSVVENNNKTSKSSLPLLLGGTAVAVLVGGVLFQIFRGEPTDAGVELAEAAARDKAGTARIRRSTGAAKHQASVNGQHITWSMLANECMSRHGQEVLESLIDQMIIQQACQEQGISIKVSEVDAEIIKIAKRFSLDKANWFRMIQAERNISESQYKNSVIWPMLALKKLASEKIHVTKEDMQKGFIRLYGERVKARWIVLNNRRRAEDVWNEVNADPQNFERLARKHSIDSSSKALDGAIPPIRRYGGNETLENAAFKLKKGEISGLIMVGPSEYAILLCEGRTECRVEYDEVKTVLYEQLMDDKVQESIALIFSELKENANVTNYLTGSTSPGVRKASTTAKDARGRVTPAGGIRTNGTPRRSSRPEKQRTNGTK